MPSLQVHLPISPTASFFTMAQLFARSLRRHSGAFTDIRIVASVGEDCEPFDLAARNPWSAPLGVEWRWVDRDQFRQHSYFATGVDRWAEPFTADYVLMADADIVVAKDFSDAVATLDSDAVTGVIATYPPWTGRGGGDDEANWIELFRQAGLGEPAFEFPIPGHGLFYSSDRLGRSPAYYNFGFVLGGRDAMNRIRETLEADYHAAYRFMKLDLAGQAGLCLSIARHKIRAEALPVRYNFWSDNRYLEFYPDDLQDLRVLHYLTGPFRKHKDTPSISRVGAWASAHAGSADPLERLVAKVLNDALGDPR